MHFSYSPDTQVQNTLHTFINAVLYSNPQMLSSFSSSSCFHSLTTASQIVFVYMVAPEEQQRGLLNEKQRFSLIY